MLTPELLMDFAELVWHFLKIHLWFQLQTFPKILSCAVTQLQQLV